MYEIYSDIYTQRLYKYVNCLVVWQSVLSKNIYFSAFHRMKLPLCGLDKLSTCSPLWLNADALWPFLFHPWQSGAFQAAGAWAHGNSCVNLIQSNWHADGNVALPCHDNWWVSKDSITDAIGIAALHETDTLDSKYSLPYLLLVRLLV